ncbi:putative phospholipid ABC transporter permease protein MlaE [Kiritimatiella glycovorans]|uniref:Putative phospholipid ABC transporter permease protein MlaE n=2 Tax=Kiritimatiella glycovorans TaxID=1307763 RepID=A0A0G3EF87_9BACT|nr:putative phospholipid ABC transporter permease protein MlaE [Kiritimatiella glycovorans]
MARVIRDLGRLALFLAHTFFHLVSRKLKFLTTVEQLQFVGYQSLLIVGLTGAFTGMVLSFQGYYTLNQVGTTALLGPLVALSLLRELGPVISALMVTGRAGSAVTAEIGIMRIGEQLDALEVMGLNPYRHVVVPRFLALIIAVPLLASFFNAVGILGGYGVGVHLLGVPAGTYFGEMTDYVHLKDITSGLYKSCSFGVLIAWICCFKGYTTGLGAKGVSRATTEAVVMASVVILAWDYFMTSILF